MISRGRTIVHANSTSAIRPALLATAGSKVPLVVHLRNSALSLGERALLRAAFSRRARNFHAIAVSQSAAALVGKKPGRKLSVLPEPVNAPMQRGDRPWSFPIRVGVVVSGSETKGFDNVVRVAHATTDLPFSFHVFGMDRPASDSSFNSRWFREAERIGVSSRLLFHGRPPSLHTEYQTLDLVLIVSRRESFGRVAVEAMRAGVPVIAPDIDGLRETVGQGVYAEMYAHTDDGNGAAVALRKVAGDVGTALRRAREALVWAARFDPSRAADSVIAVYERLLRSPIRVGES
jgi:glycosyltransferase involved in cell wall biosynthesis